MSSTVSTDVATAADVVQQDVSVRLVRTKATKNVIIFFIIKIINQFIISINYTLGNGLEYP